MYKVPLFALLLGTTSFFLPFASLKENRVVPGELVTGLQLSSLSLLFICTLVFIATCVAIVFSGRGYDNRVRLVYLLIGFFCFWLTALLLANAGRLVSGVAPRVSPVPGFWGLFAAGCTLVWYSGMLRGGGRFFLGIAFCLLPAVMILWGEHGQMISVFREWTSRKDRFLTEVVVHIRLFSSAVFLAALIGIPMGVWAAGKEARSRIVTSVVDTMQTIPSIALFGLLVAPLATLSHALPFLRSLGFGGIGMAPALIALFTYALLPIVRNTIVGLDSVPDSAVEAGLVMGMSSWQLFFRVEWPMALPYVLTGMRTASVQTVGNAAVAALVGAGGLGVLIFQGLGQFAPDLILLGVLPLILMAVLTDRIWTMFIDRLLSPGLKLFIQGMGTT